VTSLDIVVEALEQAIQDARGADPDAPLIINMSLGFSPPPALVGALLRGQGIADPEGWPRMVQEFAQKDAAYGATPLDDSLDLLRAVFALPNEERVLVIAAAGNDSAPDRRFGPRLPASVEGVLGVSSRVKGQLVSYSNRDDVENTPPDGVAAFGGQVLPPAETDTDPAAAPVGLAISEQLFPARNPARRSDGWAAWAGTSFATPIVTGLAACIWGEDRTVSAQQLLGALVGLSPAGQQIDLIQQ
jgi:subtilisin family serine protease